MKTFTYKIIKTKTEVNEAKLNLLGRKGYELCGTHQDEFGYIYYFKKDNE